MGSVVEYKERFTNSSPSLSLERAEGPTIPIGIVSSEHVSQPCVVDVWILVCRWRPNNDVCSGLLDGFCRSTFPSFWFMFS